MLKSKNQILGSFNKANKERKEYLANRAGFDSVDEYRVHLEKAALKELETVVKPSEKPVIHNVVILDASGSMDYGKFNNAQKAYNTDLQELQADKDVDYRQSTVVFSSTSGDVFEINKPIKDVRPMSLKAYGMTPLYEFIAKTIKALNSIVKEDERVLISIFTDGSDNNSTTGEREEAKVLVSEARAKNWTVTFVGTTQDVAQMISVFNLDSSNTLVHNNTVKGVADAMNITSQARASYTTAVKAGVAAEDLLVGFYKKNETL